VTLSVALAWHVLDWPDRLELARLAEARGFDAVYVDGDVSLLAQRDGVPVLDGWTVTTALLARTERIGVGSIRLVHHWNAAHLAQCAATADHLAPGRLRFLVSIGGQPADARFGWPWPGPGERVRWLDETLGVVRRLWRGETVTFSGRHVRLDGARVRPLPPPGRVPIAVAGSGGRLLEVVARHADVWDVNLPPLPRLVRPAGERLDAACQAAGRDPASVGRSMWLFARPGWDPRSAALAAEYRRWNPWFAGVADHEIAPAVVAGSPDTCRARIAEITAELELAEPVLDLSGLPAAEARDAIEALAP
jgi:alkanesulfonate monooxygenase SsuD/methylene tetrahydromethanopterin reductase-like flavin-dependent oxidoreductase (luciferase family)